MKEISKIKLGLIGANNQGYEHLKAAELSHEVEFVAVLDNKLDILKSVEDEFDNIQIYNDEKFWQHDVDAYVLALPHHVYEMLWPELMKQGKPLLKEKPLGRNLKEAFSFIDQCQENNIQLVTAIQRRTHPSYVMLKNLLGKETILEIKATLNLGFDPYEKPGSWRGDPIAAGGGALLDSGYHMVDLVHYLLGPFELLSSCLWHNGLLGNATMIDTDVSLTGRRRESWIRIESRVGGDKSKDGKYQKKEEVLVRTHENIYKADRTGVWQNDQLIFSCEKKWQQAMILQLENFAGAIRSHNFHQTLIWEQAPIMEIIDKAYKLAELSAPFNGGYEI